MLRENHILVVAAVAAVAVVAAAAAEVAAAVGRLAHQAVGGARLDLRARGPRPAAAAAAAIVVVEAAAQLEAAAVTVAPVIDTSPSRLRGREWAAAVATEDE